MPEVIVNGQNDPDTIKNIKPGTVFSWKGDFYIRSATGAGYMGDEFYCFNLTTNMVQKIKTNFPIVPVKSCVINIEI